MTRFTDFANVSSIVAICLIVFAMHAVTYALSDNENSSAKEILDEVTSVKCSDSEYLNCLGMSKSKCNKLMLDAFDACPLKYSKILGEESFDLVCNTNQFVDLSGTSPELFKSCGKYLDRQNTDANNNELIEEFALRQREYLCNEDSFSYLRCMNIPLNVCEQDMESASAYCTKKMGDQTPDLTRAEQTGNFEEFGLFGKIFGHCLVDWHIQKLGYDSNGIYECLELDREYRGYP